VGLVRALLDDWEVAKRSHAARAGRIPGTVSRVTLVCGLAVAPILEALAAEAATLTHAEVAVVPVENALFGPSVTVSGLLGGRDVLAALAGSDLGGLVCIQRAMLDQDGARTLDEVAPAEISARLGVPVVPVRTMGEVLRLITDGPERPGPS